MKELVESLRNIFFYKTYLTRSLQTERIQQKILFKCLICLKLFMLLQRV